MLGCVLVVFCFLFSGIVGFCFAGLCFGGLWVLCFARLARLARLVVLFNPLCIHVMKIMMGLMVREAFLRLAFFSWRGGEGRLGRGKRGREG